MIRKYTNRKYLDALAFRALVFDGATGTNLQEMNLTTADYGGERTVGFNDYLVITKPEAVERNHRSFLEVGVDVIETDTFRSNRITLQDYQLENLVGEINQRAARLARRLADEFSTAHQPRFVAGSMGPTGQLPSMADAELSRLSFDELVEIFCEQASHLLIGGVDLLLLETSQDILEVKAAVQGSHQAMQSTSIHVPLQVQVTLDTTGRMLLGTDITAVLSVLDGLPLDVIGLNCSTGPEHMRQAVEYLCQNTSIPVSIIPNAGLPFNKNGKAVYPLSPESFADQLTDFVIRNGVNVVGGCCGTSPEHLRQLVKKLNRQTPAPRPRPTFPALSSAIQAVALDQQPKPFLIGERLNTQGSRRFKRLIMENDENAILSLAQQQVDHGAHALDICVALTERTDEAASMEHIIRLLRPVVPVPFVIDSTEPDVIETALKTAPGRCLINSIHLEGGPEKMHKILAIARRHNAALIALTIDEQGMARTSDRKLQIAQRVHQIAVEEYGLRSSDLIFDPLTFTLATGEAEYLQSAVETLNSIRQIKTALPGVYTSLGISNVSFGLAPSARTVLNSVMLFHAVQAGLDLAIVDPAQITPYTDIAQQDRELAEDLIFNKRPDALQRLIERFNQTAEGGSNAAVQINPLEGLSPSQRLHWRVLHRNKENLSLDLEAALDETGLPSRNESAVYLINSVLLPAMKEVGDQFGRGELILPFVLQSAEVMKEAVTYLEQFLERADGVSKGTIVLATVYGDVHDIGKNLVKTILSNNGYRVVDLGKQVPVETIIQNAVDQNADAIGLSALLVSTSRQMGLAVNELQRRKINIPVLIGGAAINQDFAENIRRTEQGEIFNAGVYYCADAFEGLTVMEGIQTSPKELPPVQVNQPAPTQQAAIKAVPCPGQLVTPAPIPSAPFWGGRFVQSIPLSEILPHLSKTALYRLSWGAGNIKGEKWEQLKADFNLRLQTMLTQNELENWLQPQALYGFFPAAADGNQVIVYDFETINQESPAEKLRFTFPRQAAGECLCLADYFAPAASHQFDVLPLQLVTVGHAATQRIQALQDAGNYSEAYFSHGLAVQLAEATAEFIHQKIRRELGISGRQGKRYSWGYPPLPDLTEHGNLFHLLPAEEKLHMTLTAAFQLVPEQSTAAMVIHHPQAKYFTIQNGSSQQ